MPSRRVASKYIALAHINPIVCSRCGEKARAVWHSPLPAGLEGEMRTFECEYCGKKMKLIVEEKPRWTAPDAASVASGSPTGAELGNMHPGMPTR
jgi:DNA-directed RNA polymerase subunit RPC12/RpoP